MSCALALNPYLVAAVLLYALLSAVWVWVLTFVPLSIAYPFVALTFVLTVASGALLFGEAVTVRLLLGGADDHRRPDRHHALSRAPS